MSSETFLPVREKRTKNGKKTIMSLNSTEKNKNNGVKWGKLKRK
jgi:hypothetical protein